MPIGVVEVLSRHFVLGWVTADGDDAVHVLAECDGKVLGVARAEAAPEAGAPRRGRYIIEFSAPVAAEDLDRIRVRALIATDPFPKAANVRRDQRDAFQIFVFGSPRSGTSEIGRTLSTQLDLPWRGELHAAHAFSVAAEALAGNAAGPLPFTRFLAEHSINQVIHRTTRQVYYTLHASASFLDKTPGIGMICAAPFLAACFPRAYFIFMHRNGIANVLSRQTKFGGDFGAHCQDWAKAMDSWMEVRQHLPHYLEVSQDQMLADPAAVAASVATYLDRPGHRDGIAESLRTGSLERTGAGIGKTSLAETGWSEAQISQFRKFCTPTMGRWGYSVS